MTSTYITTTIPYINARPHLGFALELVQADVLARYRRSIGEQVRFQAGTDDNSLKNVLAAEAAGVGVQEFVDASAAAFTGLAGPLSLSVDDLIRTSSDPRHKPRESSVCGGPAPPAPRLSGALDQSPAAAARDSRRRPG
jgi:methionyl-tRNA synthetase